MARSTSAPFPPVRDLVIGGRRFAFPGDRTYVMGVVNRSPESNNVHTVAHDVEEAVAMARRYREAGAQLIDLGAQSSHYENEELEVGEELDRLLPTLEALVADGFVVSVDTWKPEVAEAAIHAGAAIVNDTGGLQDPQMVEIVARAGVPAIAMYIEGRNPLEVGDMTFDDDKAAVVAERMAARLADLADRGIRDVIVDPGLSINYRSDYVAYTAQQVRVIRRLQVLRELGHPVLIPVPRKREDHRAIAYQVLSIEHGADIIRVHDVAWATDLVALLGRSAPLV